MIISQFPYYNVIKYVIFCCPETGLDQSCYISFQVQRLSEDLSGIEQKEANQKIDLGLIFKYLWLDNSLIKIKTN